MWSVEFATKAVENSVTKMMEEGQLTESDRTIIQLWIRQVIYHGPESIRKDSKWNDHELEGDWFGYRSSSFSNRGRIIYKVENDKILIIIERITVNHNYKR